MKTCLRYYKFFETIASKPRWAILNTLMSGPKTVSALSEELGEEQSKLSHNLKKLLECHILTVEQIGKHRHYSLNRKTFDKLLEVVSKHVESNCRGKCTR